MKRLAIIGFALLLCGCAGTPINWNNARQLRLGESESDVTAQMGKPYMVSSRSDGSQVWVWTFATGFGGAESMSVIFKDGKAIQVPPIPASF